MQSLLACSHVARPVCTASAIHPPLVRAPTPAILLTWTNLALLVRGMQVEAAAVRREEELKEVESREESSFRELAALKEQVFKQSQALFNLRREESQMIADIATSQVRCGGPLPAYCWVLGCCWI